MACIRSLAAGRLASEERLISSGDAAKAVPAQSERIAAKAWRCGRRRDEGGMDVRGMASPYENQNIPVGNVANSRYDNFTTMAQRRNARLQDGLQG